MNLFVRGDTVLWRRTADRVLVLPPEAAAPTVLTGTSVALWDLLVRPRAIADVVARLAEQYASSTERVRADVEPALDELCARGVLVRREVARGDAGP